MNQGGIQIPFSLSKKTPLNNKNVFLKLKLFFYNNCYIKIQTAKQNLINLKSSFISLNSKNIYKYFFKVTKKL